MSQNVWTEAEIEFARSLWSRRFTASEIASQMRGRTRNAVIGLANRQGFMRSELSKEELQEKQIKAARRVEQERQRQEQRNEERRRVREAWVQRQREILENRSQISEEPDMSYDATFDRVNGAAKAVTALKDAQCKFPVGDTRSPDFHFCGGVRKPHSAYCEHHHKIAYEPYVQKKKADRQTAFHVNGGLNFMNGAYA